MKPVEFVIHDGDSSPNTPAYKLAEALQKDIVILSEDGEYEVISYYVSNGEEGGCMILDIKKKT